MKVLVLGAGGMAGHVISIYLEENGFEVDTISANNKVNTKTKLINLLDINSFESYLRGKQYDYIVNCVGLLIKDSEEHQDKAAFLNGYLPHYLEYRFRNSNTKLIHLSTDCVFSGKSAPYKEDSDYDGQTFYDRSKALGEVKNDKDLTFRISIVGPDLSANSSGLFNWFYTQSGQINGFTDQMWSGITTIELAKGVKSAVTQKLTGLYNLVPSRNISKYELLLLFKRVFNKELTINPSPGNGMDKTMIDTRKDFSFKVLDYEPMIIEMRKWIEIHQNLYPHYKAQ